MAAHPLRRLSIVRHQALALATVAVAIIGISCDKMPLVAPTGTAITLVASTNDLAVNGSTDVTAVLVQGIQSGSGNTAGVTAGGGNPVHNGTVVTFTTSLGRIEPSEAQTFEGKAVVKLIADGRSGKATITAFSGAASKTLDVNIGSAGATRIAVTANPQNLPPDGGSTSISARVEDAQGNGLAGAPVSFTTTKGTLSATTVLSNDQGFAITQLTTTQDATVSASSGSLTAATVAITLKPKTTITISPSGSLFVSTPASFTISANVTGSGNTPLVNNLQIDFGDGTPKTPPTTLSGTQAQTVQHLFAQKGTLTVTATGSDAEGSAISSVVQVAVGGFSAAGSATPSPATVGATVIFTITVGPAAVLIDHYEFDFGDGNSAFSNGPSTNHQFGSAGFRNVTVKVVPLAGDPYVFFIPLAVNASSQ